jgi:hypothetical protein
MSMHMAHPALSTTGKRKGKQKWASSEQKQQAQKLDAEWNELMKKWGAEQRERERTRGLRASTYKPPTNPRLAEARAIPSLPDQHVGAVTVKQTPKYTGDKIVGIGTMHKSNAVPIFSDQEAKEISSMRR